MGPVSTWMGDRLGTPGAVGTLFYFFSGEQNIDLKNILHQFIFKVHHDHAAWTFAAATAAAQF